MTATTGCFAWKVTSNKWPLLFSFQSYDSNEYERGNFVHTECYLHLNTARVWIICEGFSSAEKKRGKGVFSALANIASFLLTSLTAPFLNSGTTQRGHFVKGSIFPFIIYTHVCKDLSVHVYVYVLWAGYWLCIWDLWGCWERHSNFCFCDL